MVEKMKKESKSAAEIAPTLLQILQII